MISVQHSKTMAIIMFSRKSAAAITVLLAAWLFGPDLSAQVPVAVRCENNAESTVGVRVQITEPAGKVRAWEIENLRDTTLSCRITGTGKCVVFVQFKEKDVKAPTFISRKIVITGKEDSIGIKSSINLRDLLVLCGNKYSNRRYCILDIQKHYPEGTGQAASEGYENFAEQTTFWNYSISTRIGD